MEKAELRKEIKVLLDELPEDADWNDVMYKIYVRQSIEQGRKDIEEGKVLDHESLKKKFTDKLMG